MAETAKTSEKNPGHPALLVIGAESLLGQKVLRLAHEQGIGVLGLKSHHSHTRWEAVSGQPLIEADLLKPETWAVSWEGLQGIIDLVGPEGFLSKRSPRALGQAVLRRTESLLTLAEEKKLKRVVLTGDACLFAALRPEHAAREINPIHPRGFGRAYRLIWDRLVRVCQASALAVRVHPGRLYGQGTWFQQMLVDPARHGERIRILGETLQWISPLHIDDAAQGYLLAWEKGKPGMDYCLAAEPVQWGEFVAKTMTLMGVQDMPKFLAFWPERWRLGVMAAEHLWMSCRVHADRARSELGWNLQYPQVKKGIAHALKALGTLAWR